MKISGYHFVALQLLSFGTTQAVSSLRIKGANNKNQNIAFKGSSSIDSSFDSVSLPSSNQRRRQQELAPGLPKKRDCKLKTKRNNGIEFECTAESDDQELKIKDQIRFKIGTSSSGASVKVEYANKVMESTETTNSTASSDTNTNTETKTKYEIVYNSIIEYKKGGSNNTKSNSTSNKTSSGQEYEFDSNDEILQTIPLTEWEDMSEILHDSDNVTSYFWSRTVDKMVTFNFTVSRAAAANGQTEHSVTANKMKIDFWLQNFPWMRDDTYVALLSTVQSERHIKVEEIGIDNTVGESAGVVKASSLDSNTNSTAAKSGITEQAVQNVKPKSTVTEKVTVSFDDAMDATGNVLSMGEYTWDSTAKVVSSKQNKPNVPVATSAPSDMSTSTGSDYSSEDEKPDGMRQSQPSDTSKEDVEKNEPVDVEIDEPVEDVEKDDKAEVVDEKNVDEKESQEKQDEIDAEEKDKEADTGAGEDVEEEAGDKEDETEVVGNEAEKDSDEKDAAKTEDKESGSEMVTKDIEGAVIQVIATTPAVPIDEDKGGLNAADKAGMFTQQTIAFSFVGEEVHEAEVIYWDPEAGINYQTVSSSAISSFVSSWLTIMIITTMATAASAMFVGL